MSKSRNAHVTRRPYQELLDLPSSKFDFGGGIDVQRLVTAPRACSMHSIRTPAPPVGDRRCVARTARRTTDPQDHRPATFSRESRAEKLEESPEGRIDCVRCEVVPPPKPAQRAHDGRARQTARLGASHGARPRRRSANIIDSPAASDACSLVMSPNEIYIAAWPDRLDRLLDLRPAKPTGSGTGWTGC